MTRLIIAVIIIAAVLFLFQNAQKGGSTAGAGGQGTRLTGGAGSAGSALVPGYRSDPPGGPATTSPTG